MSVEIVFRPRAHQLFSMVKLHLNHALMDEIDAASKLAAAEEGERLWRENEDNVFGRCPFNTTTARSRLEQTRLKRQELDALLEYVVKTFINGAPSE